MTSSDLTSTSGYALLDSGDNAKLERFGGRILQRPSSLCIWKRRSPQLWKTAFASYDPDRGWQSTLPTVKNGAEEEWKVDFESFSLLLRQQRNGQVGFFPEHMSYLEELRLQVKRLNRVAEPARVLNLFAFSGMATVVCAQAGAQVCHIDIQKSALTWANQNLALNQIPAERIRLIAEDAITFVEREIQRGKAYDLIIADPPSFSRPERGKSWDVDQIIVSLLQGCMKLIPESAGALFFSSHHHALNAEVLSNLVSDFRGAHSVNLDCRHLSVSELETSRKLPAGHLLVAQW